MPLMQGLVGAPSTPSATDGASLTLLQGKQAEAVVTELHGKYYVQAYRKNLWYANIFTASAIPIFATNATPNFFIWNPPSNPNNVVLVKAHYGFAAGTGVAGALGYAYIANVTSLVGTAAPVSAATTTTINPALIGPNPSGGNAGGGGRPTGCR